jgi:hypothetical protein
MQHEINIIRAYAKDSLDYGKRSGNAKAIKRGSEVLIALEKIQDGLGKVGHLNKLIHTNQRSLLYVEEDFAKRIDPGNYDTLEEWKGACSILRAELNA